MRYRNEDETGKEVLLVAIAIDAIDAGIAIMN